MRHQVEVVHRLHPDGSGVLWVHKPHGRWRRIVFGRDGMLSALSVLGGSTTVPLGPVTPACGQWTPPAVEAAPLLPRPGPVILRT